MTTVRKTEDHRIVLIDHLIRLLKRVVAAGLLFLALTYWMRITGLSDVPGLRFDTMLLHWRTASVLMAVLLPIAALGLWGQFTWGTTSWLIAAVSELSIYLGWVGDFGENDLVVAFHVTAISAYVLLKGIRLIIRKWMMPESEPSR